MRILLFLFLLFSTVSYSQLIIADDTPEKLIAERFHSNGTLKTQKIFGYEEYSKLNKFIVKKYTEYYNNGQIRLIINFKESKVHGVLVAYWKNGSIKRKDLYKEGDLIEGSCWDQNRIAMECCKFIVPSHVIEN